MRKPRGLPLIVLSYILISGSSCGRDQLREILGKVPVVCSKSPVWIYDSSDTSRATNQSHLGLGDRIEIKSFTGDAYFVASLSEPKVMGWIPKWDVCSERELRRRKKENIIPDAIVPISADNRSKTITYHEHHLVLETGALDSKVANAYWLDDSTSGLEFVLGSKKIVGKVGSLYYKSPDGNLVELVTWDAESRQ